MDKSMARGALLRRGALAVVAILILLALAAFVVEGLGRPGLPWLMPARSVERTVDAPER